jgi:type VI secretion system protein ImpE
MTPKDLFEAGRLTDAIQELNQSIKSKPTDPQLRMFLFELLCFAGDLPRAARQIDVLATQAADPGVALALQGYRELLVAEELRRDAYLGKGLPKFIIPPPRHVEPYALLLGRAAESGFDAVEKYAEAEEETPAVAGRIAEQAFSHLRDADDRIAPVLELFIAGEYVWLPFEQIARIEIAAPARLRDLIWLPATVEVHGHPPGPVFIPVLYVNSHTHADDPVKLGRSTEWDAIADQIVVGRGQRILLADDIEHPLLDVREVNLQAAPQGAASV